MLRTDLEEILNIEQLSFGKNAWTKREFVGHLSKRNIVGMVAEVDLAVFGYMIYELHPHKMIILNFAVHPEARRSGVGARMIYKLKRKLHPFRRNTIELTVQDSNLDAHNFFSSQGLVATKVLHNYFDNGSDAYEFKYLYDWIQSAMR